MRTTITALLISAVCGAPLFLLADCNSGQGMQAADLGSPWPGDPDAAMGADDLAGSDLAGRDLASGGGGKSDLGGGVNPEGDPKLAGITLLHNQARANVNPKPAVAIPSLTWDPTIAAAAQLVANTCMFVHSGNGYGENIYASAGQTVTPTAVVNSWTSESANYNYNANTCAAGKTCGHYTQVVWRGSTKLGCAQKTCTTGSPFMGFSTWDFWVCDYSPPGNDGSRPY